MRGTEVFTSCGLILRPRNPRASRLRSRDASRCQAVTPAGSLCHNFPFLLPPPCPCAGLRSISEHSTLTAWERRTGSAESLGPTEAHHTTLADSSRRFLRFSETRWHEDFILRIEIVRSGIAVSIRLSPLAFPSPCLGTSKTPTRSSEDTYGLQVRL